MNIVEALLEQIGFTSGPKSPQIFYNRFCASPFSDQIRKPLLTNISKNQYKTNRLQEIPFSQISGLTLKNRSSEILSLSLKENIIGRLNTLEEAFNVFINFSAHSNPLGDFRRYSDFFHSRYCTSKYLFFHGDGNCVTLGILLYAFLEHYYKKESIDLYYACGLQREFMHVYAATSDSQIYVDADQKIFCPYDQLDSVYSPGLIYQLLSSAGFSVFDSIPISQRTSLFYTMTEKLMDEYRILPGPYIYQRDPERRNFSELFATARRVNSERLNVYADDFDWKGQYKRIGSEFYETNLPFLSKLSQQAIITLPAHSSLSLGIDETLPQEVHDMCLIFWGRVPLTLTTLLVANETQSFALPETPWIILFDEKIKNCTLNNIDIELHTTRCGKFSYIGMGDLEKRGLNSNGLELSFKIKNNAILRFCLPFNALAINADLICLNASNEGALEIDYSA